MKKANQLIIIVMIFSLLFGACSNTVAVYDNTGSANVNATAEENSTNEESPSSDGSYAKVIMAFPLFGNTPSDISLVQEEINKITREKIDAEIEFMPISFGNWDQQMQLIMTGDEKLDLTFTFARHLTSFSAKNQLLPLNDLLDEYGQDVVSTIGPNYLEATTFDGNIYGLTTMRDLAVAISITMKQSMVDKYNIDVDSIETIDDLDPIFALIKENEPDVYPVVPLVVGGSVLGYPPVDQLGGNFGVLLNGGVDNTNVVDWYSSDQYAEWVAKDYEWYQNGYIPKDATTIQDSGQQLLKAGRGFSYFSTWKPGFDNQEAKIIGEPVISKVIIEPWTNSRTIQSITWTIPTNATEPEAAMKFLNLMYSDPDIINLLDWGIEGVHYVVTEDGHINYPEGVDASNTGWGLNMGWAFGNQYLSHVWAGDPIDLYDQLKTFNDSARVSQAMGFVWNSENVKTEVAALTNVETKYKNGLESGSIDPTENLPKFIEELQDAGIEIVIMDKQDQLNAWLETK